jgi:hypothetical protein
VLGGPALQDIRLGLVRCDEARFSPAPTRNADTDSGEAVRAVFQRPELELADHWGGIQGSRSR